MGEEIIKTQEQEIKYSFITGILIFLFSSFSVLGIGNNQTEADSIISRIKTPAFPEYEFNILDYGAKADGNTDCTEAINNAIKQCSEKGGGKVVVPAGIFLTGAIHLEDNVNLYISDGGVLKFSTDPQKYLPLVFTRWEGVECMNYSPLIYAFGKKNIAVTGSGILDGQGSEEDWWPWKGLAEHGWKEGMPEQSAGRTRLFTMAENNVSPEKRIMGEGSYLRPPFIQFYKCSNILIEGVTIKNAPFWFIHPVLSENVIITNVKINGAGPNNDGCDPESSKEVFITGCEFNNGDDCIAIKSGRGTDGRRVNEACENIVIEDCLMKDGHGGVVIGSEAAGGIRNVYVNNCEMNSPNLQRALRIKSNSLRGGVIENIYLNNIKVNEVSQEVILIDCFYEQENSGKYLPDIRNINIENVTSEKSKYAVWVKAFKEMPVRGLFTKNCRFNNVEKKNVLENTEQFKTENVYINGEIQ